VLRPGAIVAGIVKPDTLNPPPDGVI